jgi:hypothetical protein
MSRPSAASDPVLRAKVLVALMRRLAGHQPVNPPVHNNNVGFVTLTQEGTSMTVSFAGKYLTMGPGDKLCYTAFLVNDRVTQLVTRPHCQVLPCK